MIRQRPPAEHIKVETLYAVAVEPAVILSVIRVAHIVVEAPRCYRVCGQHRFHLSFGRLHIAVEMVGLADGKSRKKLAVPLTLGIHVGVNAQFQSGFQRLEGRMARVAYAQCYGFYIF